MSTIDSAQSSSAPAASASSRQRLSHSATPICRHCECNNNHASSSPYSSPHSASLPSPPNSPPLDPYADIDLDSVSSFPSVSSSVFFSSSAGSPHSQPRIPEPEQDGLIMPSLTLPAQLQQPTAYGRTLGDVSFLFVGPSGGGKTALAEFLINGDDIVDAGDWEDIDGGRTLRASSYWLEENDPHGLERFEGAENICFTELDGFDYTEDPKFVAQRILKSIHNVFNDVRDQINGSPSSTLLYSLLASSHSPLHTALIYVIATPLTDQDREIISTLSSSIPIILFCTTSLSCAFTSISHSTSSPPRLASFQPHSRLSLRTGLFRNPQTISALRAEAADRFMRWREAERVVEDIAPPVRSSEGLKLYSSAGHRRSTVTQYSGDDEKIEKWSKATWETMLSEDVARRLRQIKTADESGSDNLPSSLSNSVLFNTTPCFAPAFDPLHLRSLMALSLSLLAPRSSSTARSSRLENKATSMNETHSTLRPLRSRSHSRSKQRGHAGTESCFWRWGLAIFCAGIGIGCMLSTFV